ncbi:MAG: hypothetical protein ACI8Y4_001521 [Candidatus Poriferisodalaceae bacterium]|jgi:hypothetical protein
MIVESEGEKRFVESVEVVVRHEPVGCGLQ